MTDQSGERARRVETLFSAAVELPADHRDAFLKRVCGADVALQQDVARLLRAADGVGRFMQSPTLDSTPAVATTLAAFPATIPEGQPTPETLPAGAAAAVRRPVGKAAAAQATTVTSAGPEPRVNPERHVGHYRLLERLGEGGMGTVYKAEQRVPVKRIVAIKLIKPGFDSAEVIARFESERQALARMDHPNIAKVLDAGTDEYGRPYFVMEYVPGVPITQFADEKKLTVEKRLELFTQVCNAIAHAHTKAMLHRDIKSGNVLAYLADGKPTAKVIDFGIAKALTADKLTDRTFNTGHGQVIGTYESMSPEQADGSPDIDTRTDVYSLGVLLYELLSGSKPFDRASFARSADGEIRRIIREVDPPRPSTRLSSLAGEAKTKVAAARQAQLEALTKELRSELEWIPLMAMRKERDRRYKTPLELAEDIQNYLADRPLRAGPESIIYRARKAFRRNRAVIVAALSLAILITVGTIVYVHTITAEQQRTASALGQAEAANHQLEDQLYTRRIAESERELAIRDTPRAIKLLDACPPELRGWEWGYLMRRVDGEPIRLKGHTNGLWMAEFSPDGKRIATASIDGTIKTWDAQTGAKLLDFFAGPAPVLPLGLSELPLVDIYRALPGTTVIGKLAGSTGLPIAEAQATLDGKGIPAICVSYSPDGRLLASGSFAVKVSGYDIISRMPEIDAENSPGVVTLWNADTGKKVADFTKQRGFVLSVAFSPDGRYIASSSVNSDNTFVVFEVATLKVKKVVSGHKAAVHRLRFSSDGKYLASSDSSGTIKLWETGQYGEVASRAAHGGPVIDVTFSHDSKQLASASQDSKVSLWTVPTLDKIRDFEGHQGSALGVAFNPDDTLLASAGYDRTVRIWNARTGQERIALRGHDETVWSVIFDKEGKRLLSASFDSTAIIWDSQPRDSARPPGVFTVAPNADRVNGVTFSPDGRFLASTGWDQTIRIMDANTGALLRTLKGHTGSTWGVAFSPDSQQIASAGWDQKVKVWDVASGNERMTLSGHTQPVHGVVYSPDGSLLVSSGWDGKMIIWNAATGKMIHLLGGDLFPVYSIVFNHAGTIIASGGADRTIRLWDARTGQLTRAIRAHSSSIYGLAFSPNDRLLATAGWDRKFKVWDLRDRSTTPEPLVEKLAHADRLSGVAFSPDGSYLMTSSEDNTVKFWNTKTGDELPNQQPLIHRGMIWSIALSPDGKRLATGSWYQPGGVKTWRLP